MTTGERVKQLRGSMSQRELVAELANHGLVWQHNMLGNIERGTRSLQFDEAVILCRVLGVSLEQLAGEGDTASQVSSVALATLHQIEEVMGAARRALDGIYDTPRDSNVR